MQIYSIIIIIIKKKRYSILNGIISNLDRFTNEQIRSSNKHDTMDLCFYFLMSVCELIEKNYIDRVSIKSDRAIYITEFHLVDLILLWYI